MDFHSDKPIYLQIADTLCESILCGTLKAEDRIPSVREYGAQIGVNPNTVMRTYEKLTDDGIIYNKDVTMERITGMLRRRLEHPKVASWFSCRTFVSMLSSRRS